MIDITSLYTKVCQVFVRKLKEKKKIWREQMRKKRVYAFVINNLRVTLEKINFVRKVSQFFLFLSSILFLFL